MLKGVYRHKSPNKETKNKMSIAHMGKHLTRKTRVKISKSHKGMKKPWAGKYKHKSLSKEHKEKLSESHKGKISGMKGKHQTVETRRKISAKLKGENSYRWKGGISSENYKIRHSIEYRLWRESVFARDNWTCQKCSKKIGTNLEAHHIKPFAEYPELRFAIDNGITYCIQCHKDLRN